MSGSSLVARLARPEDVESLVGRVAEVRSWAAWWQAPVQGQKSATTARHACKREPRREHLSCTSSQPCAVICLTANALGLLPSADVPGGGPERGCDGALLGGREGRRGTVPARETHVRFGRKCSGFRGACLGLTPGSGQSSRRHRNGIGGRKEACLRCTGPEVSTASAYPSWCLAGGNPDSDGRVPGAHSEGKERLRARRERRRGDRDCPLAGVPVMR